MRIAYWPIFCYRDESAEGQTPRPPRIWS